jgi:RecB family endonuclease NucS
LSETDDTVRGAVRLLVARCEVSYTGRGSTRLPERIRLLMIKADGTVML